MTVALIDTDIVYYAVGFTTQEVTSEAIVSSRIEDYLQVRFDNIGADSYVFYRTGKENFRKTINPEYKLNRKDFVKPIHFTFIQDYIQDKYSVILQEPYEADDLLGMNQTEDTIICSRDKDLLQVAGHHFNLHTMEFSFVDEDEGMRWFYMQILMGDRVDNVPGIRGIGPAKALRAMESCGSEEEMWETVLDMYDTAGLTSEQVLMNARMLWILREPLNEDLSNLWTPPYET